MCECGCVGMGPKYSLPGPGETTYTIQIYPGCGDCGTPIGLVVGHHNHGDADVLDSAAPMALEPTGYDGSSEACVTILHPPNLQSDLACFLLGAGLVADTIAAIEYASDAVDHCLRSALFKDPPRPG